MGCATFPGHVRRIAGAAAAALALCAGGAAAQRPGDVEVQAVEFEGNRAFPDGLLRTAIVTAPSRCPALVIFCWLGARRDVQVWDETTAGADAVRLRLFYYQRGYREAQVAIDTSRTGDEGMRVVFRIDEGLPVRVASVTIRGADSLGSDVVRGLPLGPGAPFDLIAYDATRDTLVARMRNRGHATADVLRGYHIPGDSVRIAHLEYELLPGPRARFGTIEVTGAEQVSDQVVRRMLTFGSGDVYSREALLRSQRNLFSLEIFRHAEIREAPSLEADTLMDVLVQVNEGDLHRVRVGMGLSTAEYLNAEGSWISRNFMGGARRLELRGRVSNLFAEDLGQIPPFEEIRGIYGRINGSIAADFAQPWFFDPLNTAGAGVFLERRSLPDVFVRSAAGGYLTLRRDLGPGTSVTAGARPELTSLETEDGDLVFCVSFVACGETEIRALRDPHWLVPITLSFVRDRSNSIFAPTRGYVLRFEGEAAGEATASDFSYVRLAGELVDYHALGNGLVLATRLRPGWARAMGEPEAGLGLHPQRRFFAGGANSVRGYAQYRLGPRLLTVDAANRLARPAELGGAGCTAQQINDGSCDPAPLALDMPGAFAERPVGGAALFEGNVELRFPLFGENLRGAAFVDVGQVWSRPRDAEVKDIVWSPGLGVRYFSMVGPIRIDVGYRPPHEERLPVLTTEVCVRTPTGCDDIAEDGVYDWTELDNRRTLRPLGEVAWRPRDSFLDRIQLHFSIGQAF